MEDAPNGDRAGRVEQVQLELSVPLRRDGVSCQGCDAVDQSSVPICHCAFDSKSVRLCHCAFDQYSIPICHCAFDIFSHGALSDSMTEKSILCEAMVGHRKELTAFVIDEPPAVRVSGLKCRCSSTGRCHQGTLILWPRFPSPPLYRWASRTPINICRQFDRITIRPQLLF